MEEFGNSSLIKHKLIEAFPSIKSHEISHVLNRCISLSKKENIPITWSMIHNQTVAYVRHNKTGYDNLIDIDGYTPVEARLAVSSFVSNYMKMLTRKRAPWLNPIKFS